MEDSWPAASGSEAASSSVELLFWRLSTMGSELSCPLPMLPALPGAGPALPPLPRVCPSGLPPSLREGSEGGTRFFSG